MCRCCAEAGCVRNIDSVPVLVCSSRSNTLAMHDAIAGVKADLPQPALQDTSSLEWTVRIVRKDRRIATLLLLVDADVNAKTVGVIEAVSCGDNDDHVTLQCLASCSVLFGSNPFGGGQSKYNGIRAVSQGTRPESTVQCSEMPKGTGKCVKILISLPAASFKLKGVQPAALQRALQNTTPALCVAAALTHCGPAR